MNMMRINVVLALAAALLTSPSLLAQQQGVLLRKGLPSIAVGSGLTIHFLSPEPIQYVDISSQRLVGDLPVENLLRVRIKEDSLSGRSEEHTSELQSLMRISYAVFCWHKKNKK